MDESIEFRDPEFNITSSEKINFQQILFKQIDTIRHFRNQDMGEFVIFDLKIEIDTNLLRVWLKNSAIYQQAVLSLQNLLYNYHDLEFNENIASINKRFNKGLSNLRQKGCDDYNNLKNKPSSDIAKRNVELKVRDYNIVNNPKKADEYFKECLSLAQRCKYIGGNELVGEKA